MSDDGSNRIKFAYFLSEWEFGRDDRRKLESLGKKIPPSEFTSLMKGQIFCPECSAPVFRSPEKKALASNGRKAFFAHARGTKTECGLRVLRSEGKSYQNEEHVQRAVENGELVVVKEFMTGKPVPPQLDGPRAYDIEPNEDSKGLPSEVAISRHDGEEFERPGTAQSIRGLCRNFDKKFHKYLMLPGETSAKTLRNQLYPMQHVIEPCDAPRLYYGRIRWSSKRGNSDQNIRMTFVDYTQRSEYKDFCLKAIDAWSKEQGIGDKDATKGRIVIAYGKVTESGIGLCMPGLGWGQFALLPTNYEYLLEEG